MGLANLLAEPIQRGQAIDHLIDNTCCHYEINGNVPILRDLELHERFGHLTFPPVNRGIQFQQNISIGYVCKIALIDSGLT